MSTTTQAAEVRIVSPDTQLSNRIPAGQYETKKFPVLTYGPTPRIPVEEWQLELFGEVDEKRTFDWQQLMELAQVELHSDFHCVTTWSRLDNSWRGVQFRELVKAVQLKPDVGYVMQHCYGGYTTNLPLEVMMDDDVIVVFEHDGQPLRVDHGGPVRVLVPKRYAWKSGKWVRGLEFMTEDRPGFWERNGYNNNADHWKEERYW